KSNYLMAIIIATIIPTVYLLAREVFDTKIKGIPDIVRRTSIPFIGVVGNNTDSGKPLVVLERSKSGISESFRAIRSNLSFLYKRGNHSQNKIIVITSSVGGEGKTFMSMNISSVLAVSGKKTLLMGTDMRKPKIFTEFGLDNQLGLSNYLAGNATLEQIIKKTRVDSLDIITGGPIPPNPSELLLQDSMGDLLNQLREKYDF